MQPQLPSSVPTYVREKIQDAIIPLVFKDALRALASCRTIDESKYWADKADALAAWAKIYKNNEAAAEAKRLKAHAYRRMSHLADEIIEALGGPRKVRGLPGAAAKLKEAGMSQNQVMRIRRIGHIPQAKFDALMAQKNPPGIQSMATEGIGRGRLGNKLASSEAWRKVSGSYSGASNAVQFRHFCRKFSAYELGRGVASDEVPMARALVKELRDWLDEFEESLPSAGTLP